jgi:hypothetical protein
MFKVPRVFRELRFLAHGRLAAMFSPHNLGIRQLLAQRNAQCFVQPTFVRGFDVDGHSGSRCGAIAFHLMVNAGLKLFPHGFESVSPCRRPQLDEMMFAIIALNPKTGRALPKRQNLVDLVEHFPVNKGGAGLLEAGVVCHFMSYAAVYPPSARSAPEKSAASRRSYWSSSPAA